MEGATVNDVALSVLGGALRSYLDDAGELPPVPLRAMTPVSVRTEAEKADLGNQVSAMIVSLATDVADPVERLAAVDRIDDGVEAADAGDRGAQPDGDLAVRPRSTDRRRDPPGRTVRPPGRRDQHRRHQRARTREPLYFAGAELVRSFGGGPVVDGMGLINIVSSYVDQFMLVVHRRPGDDARSGALCGVHPVLLRGRPRRQLIAGQLLRRASRVSRATVSEAGRSEPNWA